MTVNTTHLDPDLSSENETHVAPKEIQVETTDLGSRLDLWLHEHMSHLSRGTLRRWIKDGHILVNGNKAKPSHKPKAGERITMVPPEPKPMDLIPIELPLSILHEDSDLLVVNKPPGLVVHPAAGHEDDTLVHALLHHCKGQLSGIGGVARPGIVHRLDQDTSGCLVVAKNDSAHQNLASQFAERTIGKTYLAVNCGNIEPTAGTINAPIARHPAQRKHMAIVDHGRPSVTGYKVIHRFGDIATFTKATLHTGRTHQIRVHFKHLGYPLFGDTLYGKKGSSNLAKSVGFEPARQLLHAWKLSFEHPITKKPLEFTAPLPDDFQKALETIGLVTGNALKDW